MDLVQIVVLAVIQGITEFLPISSSGHLILVPYVTSWPDQGLEFDIAVHIGTLSAIIVYFRRTLFAMARDWLLSIAERREIGESRLAWAVLFGTIPIGIAGLVLHHEIETTLRSPLVVACTTIAYAVLLFIADRVGAQRRDLRTLGWLDVVVIGCAQALSLVPGTSRSGVTITAGLFRNLTRDAAARFSFLLAVPAMMGAGLLDLVGSAGSASGPADTRAIVLGLVISAATGLACIHFFLKWLTRYGVLPYVVYRLVLGAALLWVLL